MTTPPLPPWYQPVSYSGVGDNLTQLDKSGTDAQFCEVYLGPSLGFAKLPVAPQIFVTSAVPFTVPLFASRILLKAAVPSVQLPAVAQWVSAQPPGLTNIAGMGRDIWLKDLGGNATPLTPIVIQAYGTDTIDGLASYSIITANELIRLYVLSDLSGWMVG
jgi:hypothetical protein